VNARLTPAVGPGEESVRCGTYGCRGRVVIKSDRTKLADPNFVTYCARCSKPKRLQLSAEEADLAEEFRILQKCAAENTQNFKQSYDRMPGGGLRLRTAASDERAEAEAAARDGAA
jgi:hypothetical protein